MAYASGKLLRTKIGDGGSPETFAAIGGARADNITVNNNPIDISNKDVDDWRQILPDAGVRQASISISGISDDSASQNALRTASLNRDVRNYQILMPNGDTWQGPFFIASYSDSGNHDGAVEYSVSLESAGAITITPGA